MIVMLHKETRISDTSGVTARAKAALKLLDQPLSRTIKLAMRGCLPWTACVWVVIGVIALYAFVLQAFLASVTPLPTLPLGSEICIGTVKALN